MIFNRTPSLVFLSIIAYPTLLHAQHNDIRFDYQNNKIDIKFNDLTGARVGRGTFPENGFFRQFNDNPGFASEVDVGNGVNSSDIIVYNVLDRLLFWNGVDFVEPDTSAQIRILNNLPGSETVVSGSSDLQLGGFSPLTNLIAQADGAGNIHDHVDFCLEPNSTCANAVEGPSPTEAGAYGIKLSLSTNAAGIADSDPFLAVFNYDLDSTAFDEAVEQFADLLLPDLPGDYDRSGVVDNDDLLLWEQEFGSLPVTAGSGADGNNDGIVDGSDFLFWQRHFSPPILAATSSEVLSVPEPAAGTIAAIVLAGLLGFGHRGRKCTRLKIQN